MERICRGMRVNARGETLRLQEEKVKKIEILLREPSYDAGNARFPFRGVVVPRGVLNFATVACPALLPEMKAIDRLLKTADQTRTMVVLESGKPGEVEAAWKEWWGAIETFRLYAEVPQAWTAHFATGLKSTLNPRERMALPGGIEELAWAGGGATETQVRAADWTFGVYGTMDTKEVMYPFMLTFGEGDEIISLCELFTFLVLAAARAPCWKGRLVLHVSDNADTEAWLRKRGANNRMARHRLRLLRLLEARHGFQVTAAGVRTKHNGRALPGRRGGGPGGNEHGPRRRGSARALDPSPGKHPGRGAPDPPA